MMKLQVRSGRGSLVHRADDVRAAGSTVREAELGVRGRAGAYRPQDSWLPPLLWLCVYHFTVTLAWLTCMPPPPPLRSRTHLYHLWYLQLSSPLKISPRELTWCRLSRMMTSGISTALFSLLHWSARWDRYWRSSCGGQENEVAITLLGGPTCTVPSLTKAKARGRSP